MVVNKEIEEVIKYHERAGKYFDINGINTFALDKGSGEVVFCVHGVPTSSFLYRKVIDSLAEKGRRGVSVDLPGLGLTDRQEDLITNSIISPTSLQLPKGIKD